MMSLWAALWWLVEHWWLVVWGGAVAAAYIFGGWRLALAVASFGAAWRVYERGRADGRAEIERRDQARRDYLQEHYDEIDSRPRDPDDAFRRLHDRARDE